MLRPGHLPVKVVEEFCSPKCGYCIRCNLQSGYGVVKSPVVGQCTDIGKSVHCFVHDISDYFGSQCLVH